MERFDPAAVERSETAVSNQTNPSVTTSPISPLGAPVAPPQQPIDTNPSSNALQNAENRIAQLQDELATERKTRRALEKRVIELETAVSLSRDVTDELKQERASRLGLEREMAALEVEVKQVRDTAETLEAERNHRIELEKRLATLEVRAERTQEITAQLAEAQKPASS